MEYMEACKVLKLNIGVVLNESDIKRQYREAMKQNHPDLGGSDEKAARINEAYKFMLQWVGNGKTSNIGDEREQAFNNIYKDKTVEKKQVIINAKALQSGEGLENLNYGDIVTVKIGIIVDNVIINDEWDILYKGNSTELIKAYEIDKIKSGKIEINIAGLRTVEIQNEKGKRYEFGIENKLGKINVRFICV